METGDEAVGRVAELEAAGDVDGALAAAGEAAERLSDAFPVLLCFASLQVRTNLQELAEDEDLLERVCEALDKCCTWEDDAAVDGKARAAALGLRGLLQSRVLGDFESAEASFRESLALDSRNVDSLFCFASLLDQGMGRAEEAVAMYEQILATAPEHVTTINNLAALLIEHARGAEAEAANTDLARACELLERAQQLAPGFPAYNLACAHALRLQRLCDTEEARAAACASCKHWLLEALRTDGIPEGDALAEDEDLAPVRGEDWFQGVQLQLERSYKFEFWGNELTLLPPDGETCSRSDAAHAKPAPAPAPAPAEVHAEQPMELDEATPAPKADPNADSAPAPAAPVEGTTGWTIWQTSYVALRYLERAFASEEKDDAARSWERPEWWQGKRVLDLSAGMGLVGIACAKLGAKVLLTDVGEKQIETLARNVELNNLRPDQAACEPLAWGDAAALAALRETYGPFDLTVGCDLLYIGVRDNILPELRSTLLDLAKDGPVLFGFEARRPVAETRFLEGLAPSLEVASLHVGADISQPADHRGDKHLPEDEDQGEGAVEGMFAGLELHEAADVKLLVLEGQKSPNP